MYAKVEDAKGLEQRAKATNNGRTGDTYFYVNGDRVSVSNPHFDISEEVQKECLEWFLSDRKFELITD